MTLEEKALHAYNEQHGSTFHSRKELGEFLVKWALKIAYIEEKKRVAAFDAEHELEVL